MLSVRHILDRARAGAGLVLFVYTSLHLLNHSAGIAGIDMMKAASVLLHAPWNNPVGKLVLYGAFIAHILASIGGIITRTSWRLAPWQWGQLLSGLLIPLLLAMHITGTGLIPVLFPGAPGTTYDSVLRIMWLDAPSIGAMQIALLIVVWAHGCVGLHYWFQVYPWYQRRRAALGAVALTLPALALSGVISGGSELLRRAAFGTGKLQPPVDVAALTVIVDTTNMILLVVYGLILAAVALRLGLAAGAHWGQSVTIHYGNDERVTIGVGSTVLDASQSAGVPHLSVCGGRGRCSTCRVRVSDSSGQIPEPGPTEAATLQRIKAPPGVRLACQLRPKHALTVTPMLPVKRTKAEAAKQIQSTVPGRELVLAMLFIDLRGSTKMAESQLPYDSMYIVGRFVALVTEAVTQHQGRAVQFAGDNLLSLFGERGDADQGATAAIRAAVAMHRALAAQRTAWSRELGVEVGHSIGIHLGPAIVGDVHFGAASTATAIGDAVNVAARLEQANRPLAGLLTVSASAAQTAGIKEPPAGIDCHELALRGRDTPETVWVCRDNAAMEALAAALPAAAQPALGQA